MSVRLPVEDMDEPVLIINLKNYGEVLGGSSSLRMLRAAESVAASLSPSPRIMVAPPLPALGTLAASRRATYVLSQKVDDATEGKSTGAVIPESLKAWGCSGSLLNHSECRIPVSSIAKIVPKMRTLGLLSCVCVETSSELGAVASTQPEFIAIEPPELIGSGVSVSKARPALISDSIAAAEASHFGGWVLCGAGIVSGDDVRAAVRLGTRGILVASSIVKAADWEAKIRELATALLA